MESFKLFCEQTEEQEKNVKETLRSLPASHRKLIKDYKIKWQCDNTLDGDDDHVGIVNPNNKTITVSAPWKYPRQFTFLHEVAHKVWEAFVAPHPELIAKWAQVAKKNKNRLKQNIEELWCMNYANYFSKHKIVVHTHPDWESYMKEFVKMSK